MKNYLPFLHGFIALNSGKYYFCGKTSLRYGKDAYFRTPRDDVRNLPVGLRRQGFLYDRRRDDARHDAARGGRRAGHFAAGALRRRHGARPGGQGLDVDLRPGVAAEPPEPQPDRQRRPPYRLQPPPGRQHQLAERRPLRRDRQTARRGVGLRRERGAGEPECRFDPCVRGPSKGAHRKRPPDKGRSPCAAGFQFDRQRIYRRPARAARRIVRRQELHRRHRRRSPLQGRQPAGGSVAHRHRDPVRRQHVERRIPPAAYRDDRRRPGHLGQLPPFLPRCQRQQDRPHDRPPYGAQRRFAPAVSDGRGSDLRRGRRLGNHVPGDGGRRCAGRGEVHAPDESLFHPRRRRGWL